MNNFVVIESVHGKFIVNRNCDFQAETLIKTGATHIESELKNIMTVIEVLPEGAVVLDAGANIGFVCIPLANALRPKNGLVYAFEVQRMLYYALCGTVALNDLENIKVYNAGLGRIESECFISQPDYSQQQDFGTFSLAESSLSSGNLSDLIKIVKIDNLHLERLDFLKIDVEGMELDVLEGGVNTILRERPWCWIEYWKISPDALRSWFAFKNYRLYRMDTLNVLCAPEEKIVSSKLVINAPNF